MNKLLLSGVVIFVWLLFVVPVQGQGIYTWTDEHGVVHMGERPPSNREDAEVGKIPYQSAPLDVQMRAKERQRRLDQDAWRRHQQEKHPKKLEQQGSTEQQKKPPQEQEKVYKCFIELGLVFYLSNSPCTPPAKAQEIITKEQACVDAKILKERSERKLRESDSRAANFHRNSINRHNNDIRAYCR